MMGSNLGGMPPLTAGGGAVGGVNNLDEIGPMELMGPMLDAPDVVMADFDPPTGGKCY